MGIKTTCTITCDSCDRAVICEQNKTASYEMYNFQIREICGASPNSLTFYDLDASDVSEVTICKKMFTKIS